MVLARTKPTGAKVSGSWMPVTAPGLAAGLVTVKVMAAFPLGAKLTALLVAVTGA